MALPKIDLPLFETKLPSNNKVINYRPFTVKEEKVLLIAQESAEPEQMILAMKQIAGNCCDGLSTDGMAMFDLEYLMLQIRSKSVDNNISFTINDPDTGNPVELELNVEDIKLHTPDNHSQKININDDMYLMMRYPTLDEVGLFLKLDFEPNQGADAAELLFDVMVSCIDCLVNGDEVQKMSDFSKEEVRDFIETFPGGTIDNLKNFFETIPTLRYDATYTNSEGEEKTVVLEGTETFFL